MTYRNDSIHIEDLKLSNHKNVLAVSVAYNQRRKRIELRIQPLERNPGGLTMVAVFGGPTAAYEYLEDCGRFNEKRLVAVAADLKENGKDSERFGEIYETALGKVLSANGYVLAFRDTLTGEYVDAYQPETFEVGQRIVFTKSREYGWIVEVIEYHGKPAYKIISDTEGEDLKHYACAVPDNEYTPFEKSEIMGDAALASPEFIAGLVQAYEHQTEERIEAKRIADEAKAAASLEAKAKVRAEFPWAKQDGSSYARGAANLKRQLEMAFPGVMFSVKSSSASMTCSIDVKWTDGPTVKQVNEFANRYQYSYMSESDYYTDGSSHKDWDREFREWMGDAKHVFTRREISSDLLERVETDFAAVGLGKGDNSWYASPSRQALDEVEITGTYTGLALIGHEYVPTFAKAEHVAVIPPANNSGGSGDSGNGITVRENAEKGGVEVRFAAKPDSFTLSSLKSHGFRWSKFQKMWWATATESRLRFAYALTGTSMETRNLQQQGAFEPDRFDMQVEDNMAAACFA